MGMSLEETELYQFGNRVSYLASLYREASRIFLDAAYLLEINSPAMERIEKINSGRIEVSPLLPFYDVIVRRYNAEIFSPQVDWVQPDESRPDVRWSRYYYYKLVPALLNDHEVIRNILRSMEAIACKSPKKAGISLVTYAEEMTFPGTLPLWGASPLVEVEPED